MVEGKQETIGEEYGEQIKKQDEGKEPEDPKAQKTGGQEGPGKADYKLAFEEARKLLELNEDRIKELRQQVMMQNVQVQKIVKEDQDSIEIGAQATGRIKVYGTLARKQEFAAKINDAVELMAATREKVEKLNGGDKKE